MNILEIIWIAVTIGLVWLIVILYIEDCFDIATLFIIFLLVSLGFMICHWWDFLTTPLWG